MAVIDTVDAQIVSWDERSGELTLKATYTDWPTMVRRGYKRATVTFVDSRPLSDKQRKMCYALIKAISDWSGNGPDSTKNLLKIRFLVDELQETGEHIFSLSDAPMSLVAAFQSFLIDFVVDWEVPTKRPLLDYVDDVERYIYKCLTTKKCCICGRRADLHHVDRVGSHGGSREKIIHEGLRVLPLCREHHTELHSGKETDAEFCDRYHLQDGVVCDKTICKIYGLKAKRG